MTTSEDDQIQHKPAGSPNQGEPAFLAVGKLRKPHGVLGEISMEVWTDFPERLIVGSPVFIGPQYRPFTIRSCRWNKDMLLISFPEFNTPEAVGMLRNELVYVPSDDRPQLGEGEFYHHQLIGLRVITEMGENLGEIVEILETGSNDVLVVQPEHGPELLLPVVDSVVLNIDLEAGEVRVNLMAGLRP